MQINSLKARILLWFGAVSFVVLALFSFSFNYFLNKSIDNNIKSKLQFIAHKYKDHIKIQNIGIAIFRNEKIEIKNSSFTLRNAREYLHKKQNFFILKRSNDDDYIDALYIEKIGTKNIMIFKKNIDNKIEDFQDTLLWIIPILLVVFIFLASKIIDKVLIPINNLINATKDISVTKFTKNIEIPKEDNEIKELVISFNSMIERIKEGVERLDRFNSDVSHELKTPLTVIQGEIELALRKTREPQEYKRSLKAIQTQSKQIELIIQQLLLLTKYTKENIQRTFQECSLDLLLMDVIDKFQTRLKEKNIYLQIKKIEPVSMQVNIILIESVFSNLINNAIKYTPENKNIFISLFKNNKINFIIDDEGIGIKTENISKITDRFYRVDSSRNKKIKGFGLGLSIVKNSVLMHNGVLQIKSQKGNGTTVIVTF